MDSDSGEPPQLFWHLNSHPHAPAQLICPCRRLAAAVGPLGWDPLVKTAPQCQGETRRGETSPVGAGGEHEAVNPASTREKQQFGS